MINYKQRFTTIPPNYTFNYEVFRNRNKYLNVKIERKLCSNSFRNDILVKPKKTKV